MLDDARQAPGLHLPAGLLLHVVRFEARQSLAEQAAADAKLDREGVEAPQLGGQGHRDDDPLKKWLALAEFRGRLTRRTLCALEGPRGSMGQSRLRVDSAVNGKGTAENGYHVAHGLGQPFGVQPQAE